MKANRKKKKLIIAFLVIGIFSLSLGFANFSSLLKIDGSADVAPNPDNFKVVFASEVLEDGSYLQDNIHPISSTGDLETYDGEIVENVTLNNLGGVFTEDGQSITYDLLLYNPGKYDAYLTDIAYTFYDGTFRKRECKNISSSDVTYSNACDSLIIKIFINGEEYPRSSVLSEHMLKKGESEPIQVVIEYPEGADLPDGEMEIEFSSIDLTFKTIDEADPLPTPILMTSSSKSFRFDDVKKEEFETIETVNTVDVPTNALGMCDASSNQDKSVIAWYRDMDGNGLYEMYIGGEGSIKIINAASLFADYVNVYSMDLKYLDTSETTNMSYMFANDKSLKKLDLDHFDGSSVTTMQGMFGGSIITEIKLNNFKAPNLSNINYMFGWADIRKLEMNNFTAGEVTSILTWKSPNGYQDLGFLNAEEISMRNLSLPKVTNVSYMFYNLPKLTKLDITGINAPKIENMSCMFSRLTVLTSITGIEDLRTNNVIDMSSMFYGDKQLKNLDLTNFDTSNVTNMSSMFCDCKNLESLDLRNFDTSHVIDMSLMFRGVSGLSFLLVDNFDGSSVVTTQQMFMDVHLDELVLNDFYAPNLINMSQMFHGAVIKKLEMNNFTGGEVTSIRTWKSWTDDYRDCGLSSIEEISMKNLYLPKVTDMSYMFYGMGNLVDLDISGINAPLVQNMQGMFRGLGSISEIKGIEDLRTNNVIDMALMFYGDKQLKNLDLTNFDTSNVTNMSSMFWECKNLESLDLRNFDTSHVIDMSSMFRGVSGLSFLLVDNFDGSSVVTTQQMFMDVHLDELVLNDFYAPNLLNMSQMFHGAVIKKLEMNNFTGGEVTSIRTWKTWADDYRNCGLKNIEEISMKNLHLPKVTDMSYMFYGMSNLVKLDISGINVPLVNNTEGMFNGCSKIDLLDLSTFDMQNVTEYSGMFTNVSKSIYLSLKDTPANHSFYITNLFDFTNVSWS